MRFGRPPNWSPFQFELAIFSLAQLFHEPLLSFTNLLHHSTHFFVLTSELLDFAAELADDLVARFGAAFVRWSGIGIVLVHDPLDLLGDLLGLFVESGGVEILHSGMKMVDACLQFGWWAGAITVARCVQASVQFVQLTFQAFGPLVLTSLAQFVELAFHRFLAFHAFKAFVKFIYVGLKS